MRQTAERLLSGAPYRLLNRISAMADRHAQEAEAMQAEVAALQATCPHYRDVVRYCHDASGGSDSGYHCPDCGLWARLIVTTPAASRPVVTECAHPYLQDGHRWGDQYRCPDCLGTWKADPR